MNEAHDPNRTVDVPSAAADSLDAGLAAGFGPPRSSLGDMRPVLLKEADGDSAHVVKPNSDAMPPKEQTGDRYQLFGEIARGGMGAVLRGRDVDLGRDLAVKVLLEKHANRPEVARRFIEEAQIGGQLQHPGVVPVYDVGRFGERPFFTMKLVKGQTLAALLGERTEGPASSRPETPTAGWKPAPQERPRFLAITLQVAQTLAYAHAKGVIHRDLKPANVMVGAFGEVQVMDWGLAKVLAEGGVADEERASRQHQGEAGTQIRTARSSGSAGRFGTETEAGSLLGTPAYMPPEQANGDVALLDRRADVFGLGAILCEVLTGKPPYVGRSNEEVRRKAANGDLADATARLDGCGADAELIALTKACLSPEAIDRPRDARAVAEGLTAYLDGVQERLRKAELAEAEAKARAIEEAKRRRLTVALAATVLLALSLGGGGWLWVKNERDTRQAQLSRDVNDALNRATALREKAKAAGAGGAALLAQAREQTQRALALVENGPAAAALAAQVRQLQVELDEEEKDRKLVTALDEAWLAQAETLSAHRFAAERVVLDEVWLTQAEALSAHRFAAESAVPKFQEAFREYGLPVDEGDPKGAAERIRQRPAAVRASIVAALEEWDELTREPTQRGWLRAMREAAEQDDAWGRQVSAARAEPDAVKRQAALEKLAESADVTKVSAQALVRLARRLSPDAQAALLRRAQARYPADYWVNEDLGTAYQRLKPPRYGEAVRYMAVAVALRPDSPGTRFGLGHALEGKGQVDEAIACYQKAIELDPKHVGAHSNLANAFRGRGQVDEAITSYRKAIEVNPKLAVSHYNLGAALADRGQADEAIASYRKAIELDPKFAWAHYALGVILHNVKRDHDGAIACWRKAIALDPKFAKAHTNLGLALSSKGKVDEAVACWRKAIALDPNLAEVHYSLGVALVGKGKVDEAVACWRKAVALDPKHASAHTNLGAALANKGQWDEAVAYFKKAIALNPKDANAHHNLGLALKFKGELDETVACYRKAIDLAPKNAPAHYNLGLALDIKGQVEEAIACFKKATLLDPKDARAHLNLAAALRRQGRFAESLAAFRRVHELGSQQPDWNHLSRAWVRDAEQLAALEDRLPAFLKGEFKPRGPLECLRLAEVCHAGRRHHATARLYADAFTADPRQADDLKAGHRYNAACSAARAGAGQGEDAGKLDDKERTRLRKQAMDWLRADLALRTRQLESGQPADRAAVQQALRHWQKDSDLAGLRDKAALAKLPAEEQKAGTQLWADVTALLNRTETPQALAARGDWDAAAASYARIFAAQPLNNGEVGFEYAAALLLSGDQAGYRKVCAELMKRSGQRGIRPYHVARACTLAPDSVKGAALPGKTAENELRKNKRAFWVLTEQGALAYRAGRYDEAATHLEQSLKADSKPGRAVVNWLWLSLVEHRRGKPAEARAWLEKATKWLGLYPRGTFEKADDATGRHLHSWLEAQVLCREAESLLAPKK